MSVLVPRHHSPSVRVRGIDVYEQFLLGPSQVALLDDIRDITRSAPLFRPKTRSGKEMTVRMSAAGKFGWYSDQKGYRYIPHHPSGSPWPAIPASVMQIWNELSGTTRMPECCLVNFYDADARMGLHQDRDEADFNEPVVSISLGDDALFRVGNVTRGGRTESIWLHSGDVCVLSGDARLAYHGIDRIAPHTSTLMPRGGRINLTLRVVT